MLSNYELIIAFTFFVCQEGLKKEACVVTRKPDLPLMPIDGLLPRDVQVTDLTDPLVARVVAISRVLVAQAIADQGQPTEDIPGVVGFRRRSLPGGGVLKPEMVERWIREQAAKDGAPSLWLTGIAVQTDEIEWGDDGSLVLGHAGTPLRLTHPRQGAPNPGTLEEVPSYGPRWLIYSTPTLPKARERVRAGGVLDQLRRLALLLQKGTLWTPQQGATFVLTDLIPYAEPFARGLEDKRGRRTRAMSYKHMELAVFTVEQDLEYEDETLAQRMAQWNEAHPEWAYKTVEHFGGDSRLAVRRLVEGGAITDVNE